MKRTITAGPFGIFFANVNTTMGLRGHQHTGTVSVTYWWEGDHGYPVFEETNNALEAHIHALTRHTFRDATNETVAQRLWDHLDGWKAPEWERWGGVYGLHRIDLDIIGVHDDIGHAAGIGRYTIERFTNDV